jgi:hypothetical protein
MKVDKKLNEYAKVFLKQHNFVILFQQDTNGNDQLQKLQKNPSCSYVFQEDETPTQTQTQTKTQPKSKRLKTN